MYYDSEMYSDPNENLFDIISASGKNLKRVGSYIEIYNYIQKYPEEVFDSGDKPATIQSVHYRFEMPLGRDFQPQHLRKEWNRFMGYPSLW